MNLITVEKAREQRQLITASGKCGDSPEFLDYVNQGCQELLQRGDWFQNLFRMEVCVSDSCVVWPRQVGKVRAINICKKSVLLQGQWSSYLPWTPAMCNPVCCDNSDYRTEIEGLSPIFKQIPCGQNWYVRLYIERVADIGKTFTIYGIDSNGQVIRSRRSNGDYLEGVVIVATKPFVSTSILVRKVTRVSIDPKFVGNARLYGYDPVEDVLHDIGLYQPGETEPAYVYTRIMGGRCAMTACSCEGVRSVNILAKSNPDPLELDSDVLQIQNMTALAEAIQARRKREAGDLNGFATGLQIAVECMNRSEQDWLPNAQIPVQMLTFGSATLARSRIGYVN